MEELLYRPTDSDRRLKAKLLTSLEDNPLLDIDTITPHQVRHLIKSDAFSVKWTKPGFKEWLLNKQEHKEKLEYLFSLALGAAEEILLNTDPKAQSARVNMIKLVAELSRKMPSKDSDGTGGLAKAITQMDKAQLELLLSKGGVDVRLLATGSRVAPLDSNDTIDV
jgi:hypothetical protein